MEFLKPYMKFLNVTIIFCMSDIFIFKFPLSHSNESTRLKMDFGQWVLVGSSDGQ